MSAQAIPTFIPPRLNTAEVLAQGTIVPRESISEIRNDWFLKLMCPDHKVHWVSWPDGTYAAVPRLCVGAEVVEAYVRSRELREQKLLQDSTPVGDGVDALCRTWP